MSLSQLKSFPKRSFMLSLQEILLPSNTGTTLALNHQHLHRLFQLLYRVRCDVPNGANHKQTDHSRQPSRASLRSSICLTVSPQEKPFYLGLFPSHPQEIFTSQIYCKTCITYLCLSAHYTQRFKNFWSLQELILRYCAC